MTDRMPISHWLARTTLVLALLAVTLLLVRHWADDAVELARNWITAADAWYDETTPW